MCSKPESRHYTTISGAVDGWTDPFSRDRLAFEEPDDRQPDAHPDKHVPNQVSRFGGPDRYANVGQPDVHSDVQVASAVPPDALARVCGAYGVSHGISVELAHGTSERRSVDLSVFCGPDAQPDVACSSVWWPNVLA